MWGFTMFDEDLKPLRDAVNEFAHRIVRANAEHEEVPDWVRDGLLKVDVELQKLEQLTIG